MELTYSQAATYKEIPMPEQDTVRKIPMNEPTKRFYQGVSSAIKVNEAHAETPFPDFDTQVRCFWFYVGAMSTGDHKCDTQDDFANFILGASTRAPQPPLPDDDEDDEP